MIYKKVYFDENDKDVFLECYIADKIGDYKRKAILVIPGGGYAGVCADREGEPIAMAFMPYGYNAFVLHYSIHKKPFPSQLIEASWAMKYIRDNSEELGIDKVFAVGCSAGGHLAACLAVLWDNPAVYEALDIEKGYNRPDGAMLIYPVISTKEFGHADSFKNLYMTETPSKEQLFDVSIEEHADRTSSPMFIMHTSNDEIVPVMNSLVLAEKLAKEKIEFELHIYPDAPHGIAVATGITALGNPKHDNPEIAKWVSQAAAWAENI